MSGDVFLEHGGALGDVSTEGAGAGAEIDGLWESGAVPVVLVEVNVASLPGRELAAGFVAADGRIAVVDGDVVGDGVVAAVDFVADGALESVADLLYVLFVAAPAFLVVGGDHDSTLAVDQIVWSGRGRRLALDGSSAVAAAGGVLLDGGGAVHGARLGLGAGQ